MDKIRVNSGIVIEVNDNGDTITVNAEDHCFVEKFYALIDRLDTLSTDLKDNNMDSKGEREQLRFIIERTKEIMTDIDTLFGENACKKVFGDIVPNAYLLVEFFEQLEPTVKKYMSERNKKISEKYRKGRKGARSNKYRTKEEIIQDAMR